VHSTFYSDDEAGLAQAEAFAQRENKPGFAIYDAVNVFCDDATLRNKETVDSIIRIACDIDLKDIEEGQDVVVSRLTSLPYPPSEVRASGHGVHAIWNLKEAVPVSDAEEAAKVRALRTRCTTWLCADPSIDHDAALLRRPGTTNSKDPDNPVICAVVAACGATYDPGDIEDLLDDLGEKPLFTRKAKVDEEPAFRPGNGKGGEWTGPVDVNAAFASIVDGATANIAQPSIIASRLMLGDTPDEVLEFVVDRTMERSDSLQLSWDREYEVRAVRKRIFSSIGFLQDNHDWSETGELPPWMPADLQDAWVKGVVEGRRVRVCNNGAEKLHVRTWVRTDKPEEDGCAAEDTQPEEEPKASGSKDSGAKSESGPLPRIRPIPFAAFDFATLAQRQWLYGRHYMRGIASATISPGGGGKTSLELLEAILMATTRPLLGEQPTERLRVWYHNGEDGTAELNRRIAAICIKYGIDPHELESWLFVTSGLEMPIKIASGTHEAKLDKVVAKLIVSGIQQDEIDVLTLDPLITLHSLSEAGNHMMDPVIRTFSSIANELNCSIELAHHTRKKGVGQDEYSTADARGASAIIDAVRSARILNSLNDKDAQLLGVADEIERMSYFRLDRGKTNMTKRGGASYYRFASVELPNGIDGGPGDDVGTVERVMPPDVGITLSENDVGVLVAECANSDQHVDVRADGWFGKTIADHFDLDLGAGVDRLKVEGVIRDLISRKVVKVAKAKPRNAKDRHKRDLYVPF
jgi:hypothetical protein